MWWREVTLQTHAGKHTDTEHYMFLFLFFHFSFFNPHPRMCLLILERKEGKERERNIDVRETSIGRLPQAPQPGMEPTTWVCAPTRTKPSTFCCMRWHSHQLSHRTRACNYTFLNIAEPSVFLCIIVPIHLIYPYSTINISIFVPSIFNMIHVIHYTFHFLNSCIHK